MSDPADFLYFLMMMQLAGFIVGLTYSAFFHWIKWD